MVFLSSGVSRKSSSTSSVVGGGGGGKLPSAPSPMGKSVSGTALNLDLAKLSLSPSSSGSELGMEIDSWGMGAWVGALFTMTMTMAK